MKISKTRLRLFSWLFIVTGLFFILLSIEVISVDDSTLNAPKWVIGLCGFVFSLSGIMVLLGEKSTINNLLGGILVLSFGLIGGWVALFGASENFSGGSFFLTESQNVLVARIIFGFGSLLCFGLAIYAFKLQLKSKTKE